jgi:succinoglycan biosynthesis protein ExoL
MPGIRLAYVVHDLADPAVARRLEMLRPFLADAVVLGFHRAETPPERISGWPAIALGRTQDARMAQRAAMVLRARLALGRLRPHFEGRDVILSRQLETLVLARAAQTAFAPKARLAQECLDVHRLMVRPDLAGRALRALEGRLLAAADLLVISSPAFLNAHLRPAHGNALPRVELIENKVLASELGESSQLSPPSAPP